MQLKQKGERWASVSSLKKSPILRIQQNIQTTILAGMEWQARKPRSELGSRSMRRPRERQKGQGARYRDQGVKILLAFMLFTQSIPAQIVAPEVRKVSEKFVCQCGCNYQLSACGMVNCGSATPLREEIGSLLRQGKNEEQVVSALVGRYGKVILSAPTNQGLDLAAWILPFVMLFAGLIFVYITIQNWVHGEPASVEERQSVSVPESYKEKIERELRELDL